MTTLRELQNTSEESVSQAGDRRDSQPETTRSRDSGSTARGRLTYLAVALLLPLLAVPLFLELGRSDFFLHHGASVWVRSNDAVFSMHGRTCDVLIFGDSTAMTGINPEILARDTGLTTCNISVTNSVLAVTQDLTLNRFLANNTRPQILIFQFSPESFTMRRQRWEETIYPEGLLEMLRWGDPRTTRTMLWTHPRETLAFAGYSAGFSVFYVIKQGWGWLTHARALEDTIVVHNGFFTAPLPAQTSCTATAQTVRTGDRSAAADFAADLRRRYAPRSDNILVDVAPIPDCDANLAALEIELHGVTSNVLEPLPIALFNDERHYTAAGSTLLSHQLAQRIERLPRPTTPVTVAIAPDQLQNH